MARRPHKGEGKRYYMISAVSQRFGVHPQTLRLYERDGLLKPSRTDGNTRMYTDEDLERLEIILNLTRNLGVNLAGVEIVLNMRQKMALMQDQMNAFMEFFLDQLGHKGVTRDEVRERALARLPQRSLQVLLDRLAKGDDREE
ncbi:MAG: MerR family transcriptional regulator [Acidobacteriota bacterium]